MTIVEFWKKFDRTQQPNALHPDDRTWLSTDISGRTSNKRRGYRDELLSQTKISLDEFSRSDLLDPQCQPRLHLGLLPLPYMGDLQRARIIILLTNPGVAPGDYRAEEDQAFLDAYDRNLKQDFGDYQFPFFHLDPRLHWTPAFRWWASRLQPLIELAQDNQKSMSYQDALKYVANKVAVLELAPYHSPNQQALGHLGKWQGLRSVEAMKRFSRTLCSDPRKTIVMYRQRAEWAHGHDCQCIPAPSARGVSLNQKLLEGGTVLDNLRGALLSN